VSQLGTGHRFLGALRPARGFADLSIQVNRVFNLLGARRG